MTGRDIDNDELADGFARKIQTGRTCWRLRMSALRRYNDGKEADQACNRKTVAGSLQGPPHRHQQPPKRLSHLIRSISIQS